MIRHGQSQANAQNIFAGHSDFDLTEFGKSQASLAAEYLYKHEKIDKIYSSDLLRAYHTACPVAEAFGLPIIKDTALREIFAGEWEGLSFPEIKERYPTEYNMWMNDYSHVRCVGGESTIDVYNRVIPYVTDIAKSNEGKCVLLSTHATIVRAIEAYSRGYASDESGEVHFSHNASINIYIYENGKIYPVRTDITDHIKGSMSPLPPNA